MIEKNQQATQQLGEQQPTQQLEQTTTRPTKSTQKIRALSAKLTALEEHTHIKKVLKFTDSPYFLIAYFAYMYLNSVLFESVYGFYLSLLLILFLLIFSRNIVPIATITISAYYSLKIDQGGGYQNTMAYYGQTHNLVQLLSILFFALLGFIFFSIRGRIDQNRKLTLLDISVLIFGGTFLLNGAFYQYDIINLFFGSMIGVSLIVFYFLFTAREITPKQQIGLCRVIMALGALICLQILTNAATGYADGRLFVQGTNEIDRFAVTPAYSHPNYSSATIIICLIPTLYLAAKEKHGWIYCLVATAYFGISLMQLSRGSTLIGAMVFPTALIAVCLKGNNKKSCLTVTLALAAVGLIGGVVMIDKLTQTFARFFRDGLLIDPETGGFSDNNRFNIYLQGLKQFTKAPILGSGFAPRIDYPDNDNIFSNMYHSLPIQVLASMGIVGFLALCLHIYAILRKTIKTFCTPTFFAALATATVLALSLLDNHIFNPALLIVYTILLATLEYQKQAQKSNIIQ